MGSPTLTRGKAIFDTLSLSSFRITPAYAGKRAITRINIISYKDHPRLRGEKQAHLCCHFPNWGSPPLTRGKVPKTMLYFSPSWITPAYAGKRDKTRREHPLTWDHPRLRGEKEDGDYIQNLVWGSPPLTRGKASDRGLRVRFSGITPAYAGKSKPEFSPGEPCGDHPRLRGEKT